MKEKYFGEAELKDKPKKKLSLIIKNGSVTTEKLSDKSITLDKLADDVILGIGASVLTNPDIDAVTDGSFDGGKIDLCGCTEIPDDYVSSLP